MYDLIIVGGNLVGASCALYLSKLRPDFKIGIIETQEVSIDDNTLDSRIYAISPQNYRILRELNAWPEAKYTSQIIQMDIFGDGGSKLKLDAIDSNGEYLAKVIESKRLLKAINQQIKTIDNIEIIRGYLNNISVESGVTKLSCDNGATYNCRLCIAADGANSFIRKQLDIKVETITYNQYGIVANFECELPHNNIAYQWFLPDGEVLAYLPLSGRQISIVWSSNNPEPLTKLSADAISHKVARAGNDILGSLKMLTSPAIFPLGLTLVDRMYANGVVLIGDAAHTIHPLAGQGVNLGFADVWLLVDILSKYKKYQLNDTAILIKYNNQRLISIREMQLICHGLHGLFKSDTYGLALFRNYGVNLINKSSLIKKLIYDVV